MEMNLLSVDTISFDETIETKDQLFNKAAILFEKMGVVSNYIKYKEDLYERERQVSTGIEEGFGIPHAKSKYVIRPAVAFIKTKPIADYVALDDTNIECAFIIAVPENSLDEHLLILSCLARKLMDDGFRSELKRSSSAEEIMSIIEKY